SYSGGEMLVDLLGYVASDSLRNRFLQTYYQRFKFRHPTPEDVEKVAEDMSGLRLDWFFEQALNTTRTLDYALTGLSSRPDGETWQTEITLRREDEAVMPLDVRLVTEDGLIQWVNIPLSIMEGHKPVPRDWKVAEPWNWTRPTYTLRVETPARVIRAEIDPLGRMPDRNRLNNRSPFPIRASFLTPPKLNLFAYSVGWRPLMQYAYDYGLGEGVQARGEYLFDRHRVRAMVKIWPRVILSGGEKPDLFYRPEAGDVSFFDGIDYELRYTRKQRKVHPYATLGFSAEKHLGLLENRVDFQTPIGLNPALATTDRRVSLALIHQLNPTDRVFGADGIVQRGYDGAPLPEADPIRINPFRRENMLSMLFRFWEEHGADRLEVGLELGGSLRAERYDPAFAYSPAQQSANRFYLDAAKTFPLGSLRGRARFRFGLGARDLAFHKLFRLGAASFEDRWRNDAFRAAAAPFRNPIYTAHLDAFDGPGPAAYLLSFSNSIDGRRYGFTPLGRKVIAGSLSLTSGQLSDDPWLRPLRLEAFSGIGDVWDAGRFLSGFAETGLLADAGLALRYDVAALTPLERWIDQSDVLSGLQFVAKFPLWVNKPDRFFPEESPFAFRWLIGVQVGD
ncbi:MAG: M1 family metallopeptidase, partial [Rhodothermales bacterium]